jgi:hypothetical protein
MIAERETAVNEEQRSKGAKEQRAMVVRLLRNRSVRVLGTMGMASAAAFLLFVWMGVITVKLVGGGAGVMLNLRGRAAVAMWYEPTVGCVRFEAIRRPVPGRPAVLVFGLTFGSENRIELGND